MSASKTAPQSDSRRFDPFRVLPPAERRSHMEAYLRFLADRDGELDLEARTLSSREAFFDDLALKPVEWTGAIDHEAFFENFLGGGRQADDRRPIDVRTLWLVAIAKSNESESYGVDLELARFFRRGGSEANADPAYLHLILQEHYHSKILLEACETCGLSLHFRRPRWPQRLMIQMIMRVPERIRWIPILCGEVLGSVVFAMLRERCDVFSSQPEVEARLRMLLSVIELDEVLHVAYLRARLGPIAIRVARLLAPVVAAWVLWDVPEFGSLGVDRKELMARLRRGIEVPGGIDWMRGDHPLQDQGSVGP